MIILGVDPGTLVTGYGVIEHSNGTTTVLACDAIKNNSSTPLPSRLKKIFETLSRVITEYHPDELALETAFYGKNAQSALKLGHARGVAMLAAISHDIPTHEYSPREVKKSVVGNGAASKQQVQYMVKSLLRMKTLPKYFDTTDALAVAMCHLSRIHTGKSATHHKSWKSFVTAHPEKVSSQTRRPTK